MADKNSSVLGFQLYSAQTGREFGRVEATSERDAVEKFAQSNGWADAKAMWEAGRFEYIAAAVLQ